RRGAGLTYRPFAPERRALSFGRVDADLAAHPLDEFRGDRHSETRPALLPAVGGVRLGKVLEDACPKFRSDARPLARDAHAHVRGIGHPAMQADVAAFGGVLDGVRQEIAEDLLQARGVYPDLDTHRFAQHAVDAE